jgi:ankyrin repeat protein
MDDSQVFTDLILLYGIALVVLIAAFCVKYRSKVAEYLLSRRNAHSESQRGLPPVERFLVACQSGNVNEVKRLIRTGVSVNSTRRRGGKTGLMLASANGHVATVRILLKMGAKVNITGGSSGKTALIRAAESGELEVVRLLLGHGAEINSGSAVTGKTALMGAVENGSLEMTQFLIDAGADVNVKNRYGKTAADIAFEKGFEMILTLLKIYGAQLSGYSDNEKEHAPTAPADKYYAVLECKKTDSIEVIKAKYRTLVKQYHPDVIQGKGLPADFIEFANEKFQSIREAYQQIIQHHR